MYRSHGKSSVFVSGSLLLAVSLLSAVSASADGTSTFSGTLATPESTFETTLTLTATSTVTLQTDSFGEGETDPFLAIFAGSGDSASILTDGLGNTFGTSLDLTSYTSFMGCPPAATQTIGGSAVCGDITMILTGLAAGTYTIVLSDGQYIANAVFDNGTLGEGFTDLTGGQFCNLVINGVDCTNTEGTFSFDVTTTSATVPEPASLSLLGAGLIAVAGLGRRRK